MDIRTSQMRTTHRPDWLERLTVTHKRLLGVSCTLLGVMCAGTTTARVDGSPAAFGGAGGRPGHHVEIQAASWPPAELEDVVSLSGSDAFAAGNARLGRDALLERWNGSRWRRLSVPERVAHAPIDPIAVLSDTDVWAVGLIPKQQGNADLPYVVHWDGQTWQHTPLPGATTDTFIEDATAISATDAWLVGDLRTNAHGGLKPVSYHWSGNSWERVNLPATKGRRTGLFGVSGTSSTDVWGVGATVNRVGTRDPETYVVHWDGSAWSRVTTPSPGAEENILGHVAAVTPGNVWALGETAAPAGQPHSLLEHEVHGVWKVVDLRAAFRGYTFIDIGGDRPNDVWLVGFQAAGTGFATVAVQWNGRTWHRTPTPNPGGDSFLEAVSVSGPGATWAVGDIEGIEHRPPLRLLWNGHAWVRK
ncbi:MAG: hypothetical protein QOI06_149 [Nocardioidaceae bacterium]|nr:hypothetical protein [Nocardioidaceae bacterium]